MRAGLLSQPQVIERINRQFVSTTLPQLQLFELSRSGNELAREVANHWQIPLMLVFLSPEGRVVTKLSSLKELNEVHPNTTRRPEAPQYQRLDSESRNTRVFLEHLDKHFPLEHQP